MIQRIEPTPNELHFFNGYLAAIDFTETGDIDQPATGSKLDPDFERESLIDCLAFYSRIECYLPSRLDALHQAGIDFWLTRNGHGSGFWDRPEIYGEECAARFTKQAEFFGEIYPSFEAPINV